MPPTTQTETQSPLQRAQAEVAQAPQSATAHTNLGWSHYGAKAFAEALDEFDRALALDNGTLDAHYGRGLALRALHRNADAKEAFSHAIAMAGSLEDTVRGLMLARLARGQINEMDSGEWGLASEMWKREA